jgi:mono/diheme cytochrome c family protein
MRMRRSKERGEMRDFFRARRSTPGSSLLAVPALLAALGACGPSEDPGFEKVINRRQDEIPAAAAPAPPPVVAGIGGGGARLVARNLPAGVTQEMVDQGQELYGTVCTACHGAAGAGAAAAPPLNDAEWLNITGNYDEIVRIIHTGVPSPKRFPGVMPPRGGGNFDDAQIRALAAYVYALSHQGGA